MLLCVLGVCFARFSSCTELKPVLLILYSLSCSSCITFIGKPGSNIINKLRNQRTNSTKYSRSRMRYWHNIVILFFLLRGLVTPLTMRYSQSTVPIGWDIICISGCFGYMRNTTFYVSKNYKPFLWKILNDRLNSILWPFHVPRSCIVYMW